ncbi:uncharacterized protein LOC122885638 [Siniperca chuatsi]|uniref:uncharacterized protein LOC122885638 n=1 Tax=Siniperca chuatsi TaxID=119488 RepID=UPI001CE1B752|nr:uncharacterized protein LOC122885638 [Siniperca chuatsi]
MAKRYTPAQQDINAQHNRLMYTLVKLQWLRSPQGSRSSPEKSTILKAYERIQHRILVEDPVLCKAGIPLPKINITTVQDFIRCQERLLNLHATKQPSTITKTTSISSADLPPAAHQPAVLPPPDYPLMEYAPTPSTAGTKVLKGRTDIITPLSQPQPPLPPVHLPVTKTPATSTITRPVPSLSASAATPGFAGPSTQPIMPASQALPTTSTSHSTGSPTFWASSTQYKRKVKEHSSEVGRKLSRVHNVPVCTLCGQPTQGHKKYKKKTFCPVKMMSTSKGLDNRVYSSYEQFTVQVGGMSCKYVIYL